MNTLFFVKASCFALLLSSAAAPAAAPPAIAIYESQANFAKYKGLHQSPLREWLGAEGCPFDVIGDAQAADATRLARYSLVIATSTYIVPDASAAGLSQYVADGGHLVWIDGPACCRHAKLLETLGIHGSSFSYVPDTEARFAISRPPTLVTDGMKDFDGLLVGNPATSASGQVLVGWSPVPQAFLPEKQPAPGAASQPGMAAIPAKPARPAVVLQRSGKGWALLLNWILWLHESPQAQGMLRAALDHALATRLLRDQPAVVRLAGPGSLAQPEEAKYTVRIIARPELAGREVCLTLRLHRAADTPYDLRKAVSPAAACHIQLGRDTADGVAWACLPLTMPTAGLDDGDYVAIAESRAPAPQVVQAIAPLTLNAQTLRRQAAQQAQRAKLLRPLLAGTLGDYDAEPRTQDGRVDIPRLLQQIQAAHMNTYDFLIWHARTDWADLQLFLPQARKIGVKVWVTLVPPSEPPPSQPFGLDYVRWADEVAKLSILHDNLVALVIDDFTSANRGTFTASYVARIASALRSRNPRVAFLPTVYFDGVGDKRFMKDLGTMVDGIVFPYADLESTAALPAQLRACRAWLGPDRFLLINVYASGSSGTRERGPRTAQYMRSILTISREMCDGIRIYCLPKDNFKDPRFAVTAELYAKWKK